MIEPQWLGKVLKVVGRQREREDLPALAGRLGATNEVLPHLVTKENALTRWRLASTALRKTAKSVVRPTLVRGEDPASSWQSSRERPELIAKMRSLVVSRDIGWRPETGERGPHVGEVLRLANNHRRFPDSKAAPGSFIQAGGYMDRFRSSVTAKGADHNGAAPFELNPNPTMVPGAPSIDVARASAAAARITRVVLSRPRWWSIMPLKWRRAALLRQVERKGLFNAKIYLERYPDVAAAGADPLQHFLYHGATEGRLP